MSDFIERGRPVKRKREDWAGPGPGHRDNDKTSKAVEPSQQPSKAMAPPLPTEALSKDEKVASIGLAAEAFRPLTRELQRLDDQNPVLAEQAARLVALFRRVWESYVAQHAKCSRLEKENGQLQVTHARLVDENTQLHRHCRDEEARLCHFRDAIQKMRDGVIDVVETCENFKMTETSAAGGADGPTQEQEKVAVIVPVVHVQEDQGTSASH
ncbi:uncharacterized protein AKAW2_50322S [Aspergillus luchuensis]|uniref:Uncharacterized protein n=1 Tax=Aspergillus kawachii TaxID=1069201 RepID=A0A7R7ZZC7_ASPKA|nr:uncharacterized protein AKAW2_50322S [Aspergillus luchuensis]BCR99980.1 hypothetical protein AKAW2_50322S [Aspergillus luchuensis]GAA92368.1 hypothetical protein AKAW_10482 [Aspergillus luchuensis IFO 4308]